MLYKHAFKNCGTETLDDTYVHVYGEDIKRKVDIERFLGCFALSFLFVTRQK